MCTFPADQTRRQSDPLERRRNGKDAWKAAERGCMNSLAQKPCEKMHMEVGAME